MQRNLYDMLQDNVPELRRDLEQLTDKKSTCKLANCLAAYTKKAAEEGKINTAKKCLRLAEEILKENNNSSRLAIENCFLYSLMQSLVFYRVLYEQLPPLLKAEYYKQIYGRAL